MLGPGGRGYQGYQLYTQACGMLEMVEPRDAYLSSLCSFTLSNVDDAGDAPERASSPSDLPSANGRPNPACAGEWKRRRGSRRSGVGGEVEDPQA